MKVIENETHTCSCNHEEHTHTHETTNHLHGIVCSASCNHEEHERTGFSTTSYKIFTEESLFDQLEDKIKKYIDEQATLFEAPVF